MCQDHGRQGRLGQLHHDLTMVTGPKASACRVLHSHLLLRVMKLSESVGGGNWGWGNNGKQLFWGLLVTLILCREMLYWERHSWRHCGSRRCSRLLFTALPKGTLLCTPPARKTTPMFCFSVNTLGSAYSPVTGRWVLCSRVLSLLFLSYSHSKIKAGRHLSWSVDNYSTTLGWHIFWLKHIYKEQKWLKTNNNPEQNLALSLPTPFFHPASL